MSTLQNFNIDDPESIRLALEAMQNSAIPIAEPAVAQSLSSCDSASILYSHHPYNTLEIRGLGETQSCIQRQKSMPLSRRPIP